jgi:hypothetical protein
MSLENRADQLIKKMDGGFNTISYLLTQQNEILKQIIKPSFFSRIISSLKKLLGGGGNNGKQ